VERGKGGGVGAHTAGGAPADRGAVGSGEREGGGGEGTGGADRRVAWQLVEAVQAGVVSVGWEASGWCDLVRVSINSSQYNYKCLCICVCVRSVVSI
jgi:hypothetical protein